MKIEEMDKLEKVQKKKLAAVQLEIEKRSQSITEVTAVKQNEITEIIDKTADEIHKVEIEHIISNNETEDKEEREINGRVKEKEQEIQGKDLNIVIEDEDEVADFLHEWHKEIHQESAISMFQELLLRVTKEDASSLSESGVGPVSLASSLDDGEVDYMVDMNEEIISDEDWSIVENF
eukprot:Awhi_evm1s1993